MNDVTALAKAMPRAPLPWLEALVHGAPRWDIIGRDRFAAFAGNLAHECAQFTHLEENLHYTAERLMQVWPKRFPTILDALPYEHDPELLANAVYANRMGNGNAMSGDGFFYRGRGPIQATGFDNYRNTGDAIGVDLVAHPEKLLTPAIGTAAAGWYWQSRGLNELADVGDFEEINKRIQGGLQGLEDRVTWIKKIWSVL